MRSALTRSVRRTSPSTRLTPPGRAFALEERGIRCNTGVSGKTRRLRGSRKEGPEWPSAPRAHYNNNGSNPPAPSPTPTTRGRGDRGSRRSRRLLLRRSCHRAPHQALRTRGPSWRTAPERATTTPREPHPPRTWSSHQRPSPPTQRCPPTNHCRTPLQLQPHHRPPNPGPSREGAYT